MMRIKDREIGRYKDAYLIAEIGSNHNQDKARALDMIDLAAESGANAVKFQSIRFDRLYNHKYESGEFREWFRQIELDESWYPDLAERARSAGVDFISAPTYIEAIDLLEECDVPAYKIASPQVQGNIDIVRRAAQTGKPLIMSLGYCEYCDINTAVNVVKDEGNEQIALLHCVSKYPMRPEEANLRFIQTLEKMTGCHVGFSDHSLDDHVAIAAVAMGACIIEKHVTTDRNMAGPDHGFAMTFDEFGRMVKRIRDVSSALGDGVRLKLSEDEYALREDVALKACSKEYLPAGSPIDPGNLSWMRYSGDGILQSEKELLQYVKSRRVILEGEMLEWDSLEKDS